MSRHVAAPAKEDRVSWNDVWNWCADLESTWHCYAEVKQWRVRKEGFYGKWDIMITVRWLGVGGVVTRTETVNGAYPNNTSKSLPAHLLRLLVELDAKLSEIEREKRSGALHQDRFA